MAVNLKTHDNTMFQWWNQCPRLYEFRAIRKLSKRTTAPPLVYGSVMHDALADWYENFDPVRAGEIILNHKSWPDDLQTGAIEMPGEEQDFRTKERCLAKFTDYISYWGKDDQWKILLTETPFELEDKQGFRYGGKIDLIVRWHGDPWAVDHKTTTRFGTTMPQRNRFYDQFINSPQMAGYSWAASMLHGEPVKGVIINTICTHKVPKAPEIQLGRRPILFPQAKIEEWREMRIEEYREIGQAMERNVFRPRWDNCVNKYGKCAFHEVCRSPAESRERIIKQDFDFNEWNWMEEETNGED